MKIKRTTYLILQIVIFSFFLSFWWIYFPLASIYFKFSFLNDWIDNIKFKERYNKEKEIKSVIKDDDNTLWRILDKENESLDDREFVKKWSASNLILHSFSFTLSFACAFTKYVDRKDMIKDQPKSQYLINKKIIENMTKFRK